MRTWSVSEEPSLYGYTCEWMGPGRFIFSRRNRIFQSNKPHPPFEYIGHVPLPSLQNIAGTVRPIQRLLRQLVYNVVKLSDGSLFITFGKVVGILKDNSFRPLTGILRPCRVLRSAAAVDQHGHVYFGEYISNSERGPIRIYRYIPGTDRADVVFEFAMGAVRHVHGIYYDKYSKSLWCLTGDVGEECRFSHSLDGFKTVETYGSGNESWRCVSMLFTKQYIYYAMDAEFEQNYLFRIERSTGLRVKLGKIDGPVYYSYMCGQDLFFAVTAELCPSQTEPQASLLHLTAGNSLKQLTSIKKDFFPVKTLLPGTMHFPCGPGLNDQFYFSVLGLKGADNKTFRVYT